MSAGRGSAGITDALPQVTAPPKELGLDPFYTKYVSAEACPSSARPKVSDFALREAAYLVDQMLAHRPEIRDALIKNKIRVAVMAYSERTTDVPEHRDMKPKEYWNFRARDWVPAGRLRWSVARGEPAQLSRRSLLNREHPDPRIRPRNPRSRPGSGRPDFRHGCGKPTTMPRTKGLWRGTYAGSNAGEYWAEGVQSWFDTNRQNDSQHNHVDTRDELKAYDPELAKLCNEVFGDGPWRYVRPDRRKERAHLPAST